MPSKAASVLKWRAASGSGREAVPEGEAAPAGSTEKVLPSPGRGSDAASATTAAHDGGRTTKGARMRVVSVLSPLGVNRVAARPIAARRSTLDGVKLGILNNSKPNSLVLQERIVELLGKRYASPASSTKQKSSAAVGAESSTATRRRWARSSPRSATEGRARRGVSTTPSSWRSGASPPSRSAPTRSWASPRTRRGTSGCRTCRWPSSAIRSAARRLSGDRRARRGRAGPGRPGADGHRAWGGRAVGAAATRRRRASPSPATTRCWRPSTRGAGPTACRSCRRRQSACARWWRVRAGRATR